MANTSPKNNQSRQGQTMFLPTRESCEDYRLRRFHTDYDALTGGTGQVGAGQGFLGDAIDRLQTLSANATGIEELGPPGIEDQRTFLAGPQFKNKPQNVIQDVASQFSLGIYNGPESTWWSSKRGQNQPANSQDELSIARTTNSVWVYAKKNTPFTVDIEEKTVNGEKISVSRYNYGGQTEEKDLVIWKMNILPNWNQDEGLEFSHEHEWGKADDIFTQLLSTVGDIVGGASRVAEGIQAAANGVAGGPNPNEPRSVIQPDIADTYQRTNRLEFTVPFTLFTRNHFYRDILAPIMIMNFLSFPKRRKLEEAAKELNELAQSVIKGASELPGASSLGEINVENAIGDSEKFLNSVLPGFRVFALDPPSYFNIEHSAGLFSFKNCAITNFSYKYMGPWITTTNHPQDQDVSENAMGVPADLTGSSPFRAPKRDFWAFWKSNTSILDESWTKAKLTYPIRADCQITFRCIDPLFADDWLNQLRTYQNAWNSVSENFNFEDARGKPGSDILNLGGLI